ncbi:hypothetical protein PEX1_062530 [Penicillium expansum]|nr:hypothetical protein PEXP_031420 [Penicillium expansum]KGO55765.1 hypothetical protein PEX1_062530 [Penicillium expansum]
MMPYKHEPMGHWTQQVTWKLTRARSLVRESHEWFARNDETELSAELRQIERTLAMVLEDSRLRPPPLSARRPPPLPPPGPIRSNRRIRERFTREPGNGNSRPQPTRESQTRIYASSTRDIQIVPTRPTSSLTFRDSSTPACAKNETSVIKPANSIATAPPPQGVLVDFDEDSTVVELLPGIVATMEVLQIAHIEAKC